MPRAALIAIIGVGLLCGSASAGPRGQRPAIRKAKRAKLRRPPTPRQRVAPTTIAALQKRIRAPYVVRTGKGPAKKIIFLHGYNGSPTDSILPDLVGYMKKAGKSVEFTAPWTEPKHGSLKDPSRGYRRFAPTSLSFQLAQIDRVAKAQGGKVTLIGHSFGGLGALMYAAMNPQKVDKVVLLAPAVEVVRDALREYGIRGRTHKAIREELRGKLRNAKQRLARARKAHKLKRNTWAISEALEEANWLQLVLDIHTYPEAALKQKLKVPTLLFRADKDVLISTDRIDRLHKAAPSKIRKVSIADADHNFEGTTQKQTQRFVDTIGRETVRFLGL